MEYKHLLEAYSMGEINLSINEIIVINFRPTQYI